MGGCCGKNHELGWTIDMEINGLTADEWMGFMNEPEMKKMCEVWGRVGMKGMHTIKLAKPSTDGNPGGVGTMVEQYDKKGVKQAVFETVYYERQNGGKTIYTEVLCRYAGPGFPFAIREQDVQKNAVTTLDNGNSKYQMDANALMQMRCFCGCMFKKMYPMIKFQKAVQEVCAPKGDPKKCPPGKVEMKRDLSYTLKRSVLMLGDSEKNANQEEDTKIVARA